MKQVIIYTDGACSGNPGPGGWGAVLKYGAHERELSGGEASTTNNRMELTAVIRGAAALEGAVRRGALFRLASYVIDALEKRWVYGWKTARLGQKRQKARAERRFVGAAACPSSPGTKCATTGSKATRRMRTTTAAMRWRWQSGISLSEG